MNDDVVPAPGAAPQPSEPLEPLTLPTPTELVSEAGTTEAHPKTVESVAPVEAVEPVEFVEPATSVDPLDPLEPVEHDEHVDHLATFPPQPYGTDASGAEALEAEVGAPGETPAVEHVVLWQRVGGEIVAGVQTLLSAAVYATLIVTFGFQVARVDGMSMAPTLEDHDRLIVNKLVYEVGEPRPGDIVMLSYPLNPDKMFVKRVIAKEGDSVRIVDGRVSVNGVPLSDEYVPAEFRSHDDWGPAVVQQGYYFVMGDHRNNSSDSRHWGQVPKKYIVGKVKVRWWPLQDARIF